MHDDIDKRGFDPDDYQVSARMGGLKKQKTAKPMSDSTTQPLTTPGQIKQGAKLRIRYNGKDGEYTAEGVLNAGTDAEEIITNKAKNKYFITSMAISGDSWAKGVQVISDSPIQKEMPDVIYAGREFGATSGEWVSKIVSRYQFEEMDTDDYTRTALTYPKDKVDELISLIREEIPTLSMSQEYVEDELWLRIYKAINELQGKGS